MKVRYGHYSGGVHLTNDDQLHRQVGGEATLENNAQTHNQTGGKAWLYHKAQSHGMRAGTLYVRSPHAKVINHLGGTVIWRELRGGKEVETRRVTKPDLPW